MSICERESVCVFVRARENDVDRMNENDGGSVGGDDGICVLPSSFFLSFLLPIDSNRT